MKKLSQFEKLGLVAAVIVACMFFYMKRVYEPQEKVLKKTVKKLNKVIKEYNAVQDVPPVHSVKGQIKKHRAELAGLEEEMTTLTVKTGAEREVTELLNEIMDILKAQGMSVNTLTPKGKRADPLYSWNVFDVDMGGNFHRFTRLLESFEALDDPVKIDKVVIGQGTGSTLTIHLEVMI